MSDVPCPIGLLKQTSLGPPELWLFLFNDIFVCAKVTGGTSMTIGMLSNWIYSAEGSLAAFASSMASIISHHNSSNNHASENTGRSGTSSRSTSIIENSFECTNCVDVEDMTVFGLETDRSTEKREKAFQITSPLASMELLAGE